jgi:hypothetical protein
MTVFEPSRRGKPMGCQRQKPPSNTPKGGGSAQDGVTVTGPAVSECALAGMWGLAQRMERYESCVGEETSSGDQCIGWAWIPKAVAF